MKASFIGLLALGALAVATSSVDSHTSHHLEARQINRGQRGNGRGNGGQRGGGRGNGGNAGANAGANNNANGAANANAGANATATATTGDANTGAAAVTGTAATDANGATKANTGNDGNNNTNNGDNQAATNSGATNDPNTSLCLVDAVINTGSQNDGTSDPTLKFSAPSKTSVNNFINSCATDNPGLAITNGLQSDSATCNTTPMGVIPSVNNLPHGKFTFPANLETIATANTDFTIRMAIRNLQAGAFTEAQSTYYTAPCVQNSQGNIIGHVHVVIQKIDSLQSTTPIDPTQFDFFLGVDDPQDGNGEVTALVTGGLDAGTYRLGSITSCQNHQLINGPKAQRGIFEDVSYFTVGGDGNATNNNNNNGAAATNNNGAATATNNNGAAAATNNNGAATATNNNGAATATNNNNGGRGQGRNGGRGRGRGNKRSASRRSSPILSRRSQQIERLAL